MREYLVALLRRHFEFDPIIPIGSMAELRAREPELKGAALVLLDIELSDGTTLDWALEQREGRGALVALSSLTGSFPFKQLQTAGVSLVHKNDGESELLNVIRQALGGAVVLSRGAMNLISATGRDPNSPVKLLSAKEIRVLALLGQRLTNAETAQVLGCADATAADHRKKIMRKLNLHSIEDVIDYAIRHGVIHDSRASREHDRRKLGARSS